MSIIYKALSSSEDDCTDKPITALIADDLLSDPTTGFDIHDSSIEEEKNKSSSSSSSSEEEKLIMDNSLDIDDNTYYPTSQRYSKLYASQKITKIFKDEDLPDASEMNRPIKRKINSDTVANLPNKKQKTENGIIQSLLTMDANRTYVLVLPRSNVLENVKQSTNLHNQKNIMNLPTIKPIPTIKMPTIPPISRIKSIPTIPTISRIKMPTIPPISRIPPIPRIKMLTIPPIDTIQSNKPIPTIPTNRPIPKNKPITTNKNIGSGNQKTIYKIPSTPCLVNLKDAMMYCIKNKYGAYVSSHNQFDHKIRIHIDNLDRLSAEIKLMRQTKSKNIKFIVIQFLKNWLLCENVDGVSSINNNVTYVLKPKRYMDAISKLI